MKSIHFKTIPHSEQRYPTCGDYWLEGETYEIRVSKMSDWRYEFLVLFHELLELAWVIYNKVPIEEIDSFDQNFEKNRVNKEDEPGDNTDAPYYWGHQYATICEKIAAHILRVDWNIYENEINSL